MHKNAALSAFILLAAALAIAAAGESAAQREAAGYYEAGQTGKALETCIAALDKDPSNEDLYAYALEILPEGPSKYAAPLRAITAKASGPKDASYIYPLGLCKLDRGAGKLTEALSNCKKARALDPTPWAVYRELGLTYSSNGDGGRAVETLAQGAELSPGNYKAYYYLAAEYERRKDLPAALKNYRKASVLLKTAQASGARIDPALIRSGIKRTSEPPAKKPAAPKKPAAAAPKKVFEACLKEAEDLKTAGDLSAIEKKLAACAALAPRDPQVKIDRAGTLVRLGRYEDAVAQYQAAAGLFPGRDLMTAFCHLKTAETYSRLGDTAKAILYYNKALEINKNDLNAMMGLAAACESKGDLKTAGNLYTAVLKVEPANTKARERLDEITFGLLSGDQLLEELRARGGADDKKTALSDEDLKLLRSMRLAERNGAVDYLTAKNPRTKGLIVEKTGQDHVKLMLTAAGFRIYQTYQSRDAVGFFEKKGINLRDVFALRDLNGALLFAPKGGLTTEGMQAYRGALSGDKTWLMPYETPRTPENEQYLAAAADLIKRGFREISEPEYLWLMKVTTCPDDVLRAPPCDIRVLKTAPGFKYFLCYSPPPACADAAVKLATYVERYRANDTWVPENTMSTAFFGTGGVEKKRFCHKGQIWNGD